MPECYRCKRDIGVTLCLIIFAFFCLPPLIAGWHDYWLNVVFFIVLLTFIAALLICQQHFWIWIAIATLGINIACLWPISLASLDSLIVEWIMCSIIAYPLVIISRIFHSVTPIGPYLLLWPIGWFTGYWSRNLNRNIDSLVDEIMVLTMLASIVIFGVAAYLLNRTDNEKKQLLLQWVSVISWMPAGMVPGIMGFGWKYSLFATILPLAVIYYFFKVSKKVTEKTKKVK